MHEPSQIQSQAPKERREILAQLRFHLFQWPREPIPARRASILLISGPAEIRIALRTTRHAEAKPDQTTIEYTGGKLDQRAACGTLLLTAPTCPDRAAILRQAAGR